MGTPSTAIYRYDLSISFGEFSTVLNRRGYIGLQVLTPIGVAMQSAKFSVLPKEALLMPIEDTKRAPKGGYKRDEFEWETAEYATDEHGVEEPMDDRTIAMYGQEIRAEVITAERTIQRVAQAYEKEVADAVFNATTWTGATLTTAVSTDWTTADTATPISDIDGAIDKVEESCGHRPNALIIPRYALMKMLRTAEISDQIKYSGHWDPASLQREAGAIVKEFFQLEKLLIADGMYNSAGLGQDATFARVWDQTMCMVAHVHDSMDLEDPMPTIGRTIVWSEESGPLAGTDNGPGLIVEEYREEATRGSVIRGRTDYEVKILYPECGHLLTGITA